MYLLLITFAYKVSLSLYLELVYKQCCCKYIYNFDFDSTDNNFVMLFRRGGGVEKGKGEKGKA